LDGVVLVITPQDVARLDTSRALGTFRQVGIPIVGVVENMSYLLCPSCGDRIDVFHRGHAERPIGDEAISVLAAIPIEPTISAAADLGRPVVIGMPQSAQAAIFLDLAAAVAARLDLDHADDRAI
jgi:ATP-binding protein involved in chromosome partitioning